MSPLESRPRLAFAVGLAISLVLHAVLVLPWVLGRWSVTPPPPQRDQLVVDLFGMVSNRQMDQQQLGNKAPEERKAEATPTPAPSPTPKPAIKREAARERPPQPQRLQAAPSPVQVDKPVEAAAPAPPAQTAAPVATAPPSTTGTEEERVQQTLRQRNTEADAIRKYLASLRRAIQGKLVYPPEAREAGYVGSPTIRFTLTEGGDILPGSLAVQRSSGYPALDESAMRAALSGAPFDKPPRQMEVAIAVAFARDSN